MATEEEKRIVAVNFTRHILRNKLIVPGLHKKEKVLQLYAEYQKFNPSLVQRSEIVDALKRACLVKNRRNASHFGDNGFIEFKDQVFRSPNGVTLELRDLMNPRIRLVERPNVTSSPTTSNLAKAVKKIDLNGNDTKVNCREPEVNNHEEFEIESEDSKLFRLQSLYRNNRNAFTRQSDVLKVENVNGKVLGVYQSKEFAIKIRNISKTPLTVSFHRAFNMYNLDDVNLSYDCESIDKGDTFEFILTVNFRHYGVYLYPVVFEISTSRTPNDIILFLIEPKFEVLTEEVLDLGPVDPYHPLSRINNGFDPLPSIHGDFLSSKNALMAKLPLFYYPIRPSLKKILNREFKPSLMLPGDELELNILRKLLCNKTESAVMHNRDALNIDNYVARFRFLLWIEEHEEEKEMEMYNQTDVLLKLDTNRDLIRLMVPGLAEGRPSIMKGDRVYVREKQGEVKYEGVVHIVEADAVYLAFNHQFRENYLHYRYVDVEFSINESGYRLCHRALNQCQYRQMVSFLFPTERQEVKKKPSQETVFEKIFNTDIATNREQMTAIKNIVESSSFPAPYILFGPPGTGKTATIVEAIAQIWHIYQRGKKICVCAPSNSAADLITKRILQYKIPAREVLRLYALSRSDSEIPDVLKKCSNYDRLTKEIYFPSKECIEFKTIIVLTPITAGRLVTGGFCGGHFDYLFMDEAGHAVEPEMIVPIIGLLTTFGGQTRKSTVKGSLILAGDPKQLGPVIQSKLAVHIGFEMSLLERLMMQCKLYQKDPETLEYNPAYITKLVNNYRSHKNILHIPNLLFYDNELKVKGNPLRINCATDWVELQKPGFPVIFHSIKGQEERESNSPSYFNVHEVAAVGQYLQKLINHKLGDYFIKEEHIGIITPYKKQVQKLRQYLRKPNLNWTDVTVASVEEFQGQERLIIIISTVRSQIKLIAYDCQFGLGFLKNAKRFNVAVTRAVALLIVIGNPDILQCDPNWRSLIQFCIENKSYVGPEPSHSVPSDFQPVERSRLDLSVLIRNADYVPADQ